LSSAKRRLPRREHNWRSSSGGPLASGAAALRARRRSDQIDLLDVQEDAAAQLRHREDQ
jgi:hypothetical protein